MPTGIVSPTDWGAAPDPEQQKIKDRIDAMNAVWGGQGSEAFNRSLGVLGATSLLDPYTYKPKEGAWDYKYGVPQQYQDRVNQAMGYGPQSMFTPGARAAEIGSRGQQENALAMLRDYATGNQSVARQQGDIERTALANRLAGQVAARPYDPAAARGGQMALASGSAELGSRTALAAAQEKLAAQQALMQGAGALRSGDISQFGQESAIEKSLRDYQIQKDTQAQAWQKLGLGEKAAGMANAQDWEKQQIARNQYLQNMGARMSLGPEAGGSGQSTDWGAVAGAGASTLMSLLALMSDERAKDIVPSGEQCKKALSSGNPALANFLQTQASAPMASSASMQLAGQTSPMGGKTAVPINYGSGPAAEPVGSGSWGGSEISDPWGSVQLPGQSAVPAAPGSSAPQSQDIPYASLGPQPLVKGANSAKVPAPGFGGAGTQQAQPGDPVWPKVEAALAPRDIVRGVYGHTLGAPTAKAPAPASPTSALSIIEPTPIAVGDVPAGSGSWGQSQPSGGSSWGQTPQSAQWGGSAPGMSLAQGALAPQPAGAQLQAAGSKGYDIGPTGLGAQKGYDIGPTGQKPQPFGIGSFNGLIYSDERCKVIDGKIQELELSGRGMTAEAQMFRTRLDKLRSEAATSPTATPWDTGEGMPSLDMSTSPKPAAAPAAPFQESAAQGDYERGLSAPLSQQALSTTPGEAAY